jgi:translocation protein SEC63
LTDRAQSATEKEIDKHYKRLGIKFHPDKAKPDPSKNETLETVNDRWVEMTKAYKALTDEEIRNNYLMYGNPDGKQGTSIGIALPKWMVEENNRWFVVAFYGILLGVVLPYTLGSWWYGTQSRTKERVLHASAGNLFREWKEDINEEGVVGALSVGDEFNETTKPDTGAAKAEGKVLNSALLSDAAKSKLKSIEDPVRRKTLSLLWAYLNRIDLEDPELEKEKYTVAPTAFLLNHSFSMITLPFQLLNPLIASYNTSQNLIQAIPPNGSPALQLPHFTPEAIKKLSGQTSKSPLSIQKLMSLPPHIRRSLCADLSDAHYDQAMKVASQIPHLHVAKAFFKVIGDRVVTPSSLVQLVVKARVIPPGTKNIPAINIKDLDDKDPAEGDLDALHGRKKSKDGSRENAEQPPLAHAPYYAADHAPRWHIFLADSKAGRIAVPPFTFTAFDKPAFDADGKPTFNMLTFRCQFQAPPQVANFPFTMHLICDSYIGLDSKIPIVLEVKDVSEADVVESDDDISEPEEDSLAGQLQAMKTGGLTGPPPKKKMKKPVRKIEEVASSDESDTDGSVEETSETDTETEDEG